MTDCPTTCPKGHGPLRPAARHEKYRTVAVRICWECGWDTDPMYPRLPNAMDYENKQNQKARAGWYKLKRRKAA